MIPSILLSSPACAILIHASAHYFPLLSNFLVSSTVPNILTYQRNLSSRERLYMAPSTNANSIPKTQRNNVDEKGQPKGKPPIIAPDPANSPYYFEGGLRRVHPYHHTYNTFCKERWRNRELVDIFTSEFRDRKPEYYVGLLCLFETFFWGCD